MATFSKKEIYITCETIFSKATCRLVSMYTISLDVSTRLKNEPYDPTTTTKNSNDIYNSNSVALFIPAWTFGGQSPVELFLGLLPLTERYSI